MTELNHKSASFSKIEFWILTTLFAFILLLSIRDIFEWDDSAFADVPYRRFFDEVNMHYDFYGNYFFPQIIRHISLYVALLALNFVILPQLLQKKSLVRNILFLVFVLSALTFIYGSTGTYLQAYRYAGNRWGPVDR